MPPSSIVEAHLGGPNYIFNYCSASTVSFNPTALVTATSVESRGFLRTDKVRYGLSRSMPAGVVHAQKVPTLE
jgi:hypothetical protein